MADFVPKKYNEFVEAVPDSTDIIIFGNPITGELNKVEIGDLPSGGFFTPSVASANTEQDCNGHNYGIVGFEELVAYNGNRISFSTSGDQEFATNGHFLINTNTGGFQFSNGSNNYLSGNEDGFGFGNIDSIYKINPIPVVDSDLSVSTHIIGIDSGDFSLKSIPVSYLRPYKVYTALLTQSGTDAPVATVLENTLGGTVVWTRVGIDDYIGTLTDAFVDDKTWLSPATGAGLSTPDGVINFYRSINDFVTLNYVGNEANSSMLDLPVFIEIRVYN